MSKFGAIIEQAKSQNTGKPENQKDAKQENQITRKPVNLNVGKPENQKTGKPVSKAIVKKAPHEKDVNLSIKVPEARRRHWVSEAKRRGTSLTAVIVESLSKQFGEPE